MKYFNFVLSLAIVLFIILYGHAIVRNQRLMATGINSITTRQISILAQLTCPPELKRVYYDPAVDAPEKKRTSIPRNEKLIPKKQDRGGTDD